MAELHLYDFDGTLFRAPDKPDWWGHTHWFGSYSSLGPPCVPEKPGGDWWISSTVADAKKSISNPEVWAILCTGRTLNSAMRYRIPEMLKQKGLSFDEVYLNPGKDTKQYKIDTILKILGRFPDIDTVQIWEDHTENMAAFCRAVEATGRTCIKHPVRASTMPVMCTPQEIDALADEGWAKPRRVAARYLVAGMSKAEVLGLAAEFADEYHYPLGTCDLNRGDCDSVSNVLGDWLEDRGIDSELLMGAGFIPPLGKDANDFWLMLTGDQAFERGDKGLTHVVVQVGNWVIDMTGSQFGRAYKNTVYPVSEFKKMWSQTANTPRAHRQINDIRRMLLQGKFASRVARKYASLSGFMSEYHSRTDPGEGPMRIWEIGDCLIGTVIEKRKDEVYFQSMQLANPDECGGRGMGSAVLKQVIRWADKHDVVISMVPEPIGHKRLSLSNLIAWYRREGFERVQSFPPRWVRQPGGQPKEEGMYEVLIRGSDGSEEPFDFYADDFELAWDHAEDLARDVDEIAPKGMPDPKVVAVRSVGGRWRKMAASKGVRDLPEGWYIKADKNGPSWMFTLHDESGREMGHARMHQQFSCGGSWVMNNAYSKVKGWGPLLYDVALEFAGAPGLMPDRGKVSPEAQKVWEFYLRSRPDVDKIPLHEDPKVFDPRDCGEHTDEATWPKDEALDFRYIKKNQTVIPALEARGAWVKAAREIDYHNPVHYLGAFLTPMARQRLLRDFPPVHGDVHADHMTIVVSPTQDEIDALRMGRKVGLKVVGYAEDEKGQAVLVVPTGVKSMNRYPHITISTAPGVSPAYSNELVRDSRDVVGPMLDAVLDTYPRRHG